MPGTRKTASLAGVALLLAAGPARSEQLVLTHVTSIYADEKDVPLKSPEGVACSESGALVVADTGNGRLVTYSYKDGSVRGGTALKPPQVAYPVRVQIDSKGNLLVLDQKARRIARLESSGAYLGPVEPKGAAGRIIPGSFKLDGADNLYLLDVGAAKVVVLDPAGNVTRTLDLPGGGALFTDICVDAAGTLYAIDANGAAVWSAARDASAFQALTKSLKDYMNFPAYVAADKGRLYVVDQTGNGIVVVGMDGSYQGRQLSIGRSEGYLYYPSQLCLDGAGDVFVADRANNRVQVFTAVR